MKNIYHELEEAQSKYQEALDNPDIKRWLGTYVEAYVPEDVMAHASKYTPVISQVQLF